MSGVTSYTVTIPFHTLSRRFSISDAITSDDIDGPLTFGDWVLGGFVVAAYTQLTTTISSGASLSADIPLHRKVPVSIAMPASWTAANLSFQASVDNGSTWSDIYNDSGSPISMFVSAGIVIRLRSDEWIGFDWLRIRSGTAAAAVTQGADRVLTLTVSTP